MIIIRLLAENKIRESTFFVQNLMMIRTSFFSDSRRALQPEIRTTGTFFVAIHKDTNHVIISDFVSEKRAFVAVLKLTFPYLWICT